MSARDAVQHTIDAAAQDGEGGAEAFLPRSRSPSSSGESRMSDAGSTVISSAALLAVEWARPQLPSAKASVKPRPP